MDEELEPLLALINVLGRMALDETNEEDVSVAALTMSVNGKSVRVSVTIEDLGETPPGEGVN